MSEVEYQAVLGRKGSLSRLMNQFRNEGRPASDQVKKDYEEAVETLEKLKGDRTLILNLHFGL